MSKKRDTKPSKERTKYPKKFLEEFLNAVKNKKNITLKELKEIEEESYDLP